MNYNIHHLKMPQLSSEEKQEILDDISRNMSYRSIAKKYGISHTTVSRFRKRFCKEGDKSLVSKSGTKHKLQRHEILSMKRISNQNFFCQKGKFEMRPV